MRTGQGKSESDAELREAVIAGWHRLETEVRSNTDRLASMVKLTGIPFRELDLVRRVRNRIAHPDQPVPRERLLAALRIIADAERQLAAREQKRRSDRTRRTSPGRATPRRPARRGPAKRAEPRRPQRRGRGRTSSTATVIMVVVLIAVAIAIAVVVMFPA
jgi:hypothetical protein